MKKHMKGLNVNVMLGLLAVLFISLGYLSMQGREGMTTESKGMMTEAECIAPKKWNATSKTCE